MPQIPEKIHELTVGQLSARSGAAVSALHFYEAKGLISSRRTTGNQRRYSRTPCAGSPSSGPRSASASRSPPSATRSPSCPRSARPTREDWARLSEAWRTELDERIKQLGRLRDHLTDCIGCGCLSLETCVLSNPDDVFGERMSGSRLLPERRRAVDQERAREEGRQEEQEEKDKDRSRRAAGPAPGPDGAPGIPVSAGPLFPVVTRPRFSLVLRAALAGQIRRADRLGDGPAAVTGL